MGLIILLILTGVLLLLAEIFVIPGVGIAGVLGVVALGGSSYYAFMNLGTVGGVIVTLIDIILITCLVIYFLRAKTWKKFELNEVIDSKGTPDNPVKKGSIGKTITRLSPMGKARIDDTTVEVTSLEGMIDPSTEVVVERIESNKLFVRKATEADKPAK